MMFNQNQIADYNKQLILQARRCSLVEFKHNQTQQKFYFIEGKVDDQVQFNNDQYEIIKKNECYNIITIKNKMCQSDIVRVQIEQCDLSLYQYMEERKSYKFQSEEIIDILSQLINGYTYMAKMSQRMDLNPQNILVRKLQNQRILIKFFCDLFISNPFDNFSKQKARFLQYCAPEEVNNTKYNPELIDIYKLGILLYQLCYQMQTPTDGIKDIQNVMKSEQNFQQLDLLKKINQNDGIDEFLKNLIQKMIQYNEFGRITWDQLSNHKKLQLNFIILNNKYFLDKTKQLGSGAQGVTFLVQNLEINEQLCAKQVDTTRTEGQREQEIYKQIKLSQGHKNIIQTFDIISTQNKQQTFIIMEKCDENIEEYYQNKKGRLSDQEIWDMFTQIVNGYQFLKQLNIIHRDLKPQNILVKYGRDEKPTFKIIDFGVGKITSYMQVASTMAGTPIFTAPEVIEGKRYDDSCDIFSLGTMLYYLIYGKYYINVSSIQDLNQQQKNFQLNPFRCPQSNNKGQIVNPKFIDLIEEMIKYDPKKRITWEQLTHTLNQGLPQKIKLIFTSNNNVQQNSISMQQNSYSTQSNQVEFQYQQNVNQQRFQQSEKQYNNSNQFYQKNQPITNYQNQNSQQNPHNNWYDQKIKILTTDQRDQQRQKYENQSYNTNTDQVHLNFIQDHNQYSNQNQLNQYQQQQYNQNGQLNLKESKKNNDQQQQQNPYQQNQQKVVQQNIFGSQIQQKRHDQIHPKNNNDDQQPSSQSDSPKNRQFDSQSIIKIIKQNDDNMNITLYILSFLATIKHSIELLELSSNYDEKWAIGFFIRLCQISCLEDLKVLKEKQYIFFGEKTQNLDELGLLEEIRVEQINDEIKQITSKNQFYSTYQNIKKESLKKIFSYLNKQLLVKQEKQRMTCYDTIIYFQELFLYLNSINDITKFSKEQIRSLRNVSNFIQKFPIEKLENLKKSEMIDFS